MRRLDGVNRGWLIDAAIATGVALVLALIVSAGQGGGAGGELSNGAVPAAYLWAAALGGLMFWRRRYPVLVLALTALGLFAYYASGFPAIGVAVPVAAALYSAAESGRRIPAIVVAALVLAVSTIFRLADGQDFRFIVLYEAISHAALMVAAIVLGELTRARRELIAREHRIEAMTDERVSLEAHQRASEHRLTLARDLHDSIGHTLTVAAVHSNVAQQQLHTNPDTASHALELVTQSVSRALTELRETVRELRTTAAPSLDDLEALLAAAESAGFTVLRDIDEAHLEPSVSEPVFRIVQEAVTNAIRHSEGPTIDIAISRRGDELVASVSSDGTPSPDATEGTGIRGMRERLAHVGGLLEAGPADTGWRVVATIPLGHNHE